MNIVIFRRNFTKEEEDFVSIEEEEKR